MPKFVLDTIRWVLIIGATVATVELLGKVHWIVGLVLAIPAFVVFLNVFGFLTLPLYTLTREARNARKRLKEFEETGHS